MALVVNKKCISCGESYCTTDSWLTPAGCCGRCTRNEREAAIAEARREAGYASVIPEVLQSAEWNVIRKFVVEQMGELEYWRLVKAEIL